MTQTVKTADLVDDHDDEVHFCNLSFLKFGRRQAFSGQIATVKCFEDNVILKSQLQEPGEGRVLVVDAGGSTRCAVVGDMIATILRDNEWAGIIINGAIRDSAEIDEMDVAVRCLATSPKKSAKDGAGYANTPVQFGGVTFKPGDYVYCDADGILVADRKIK